MKQAAVDRLIGKAETLCTISRRVSGAADPYGEVTRGDYVPLSTVPCVYSTPTERGRRISDQANLWVNERHFLVSGTADIQRDDLITGVYSTINASPSAILNDKDMSIVDIVQDTPLVTLIVAKELS